MNCAWPSPICSRDTTPRSASWPETRLPPEPEKLDWSDPNHLIYTRNTGANQVALQRKLALMEGGEDALALASGVAALHAVYFTFLATGDHHHRLGHHLRGDVEAVDPVAAAQVRHRATFVDITDLEAVRAAIRPTTKMITAEVIANPTTKVADVAALAGIAHEVGALLVIDSTFTPPPLYRPLAAGADLVIHSLTKYINGHGDAMGGAVIGAAELVSKVKAEAMVGCGQGDLAVQRLADLPRVDHLAAEADSASGHRTEPGPVAGVR